MRIALIREVSPRIGECELTHLQRRPIDVQRAQSQHAAYAQCLDGLGCRVIVVPDGAARPDGVFVEDTAVVLPELAIIARPGVASRRGELGAVQELLARHRRIVRIEPPGTLEGGDVLVVGRTLYVGTSSRTNAEAVSQLGDRVAADGYVVRSVDVAGCLHLKSGVSLVGPDTLLIHRPWVDATAFADLELLDVHPDEPQAANALWVGETVVCAEAYVRTREVLERRGIATRRLPCDELAKAEGGLTCCSILFEAEPVRDGADASEVTQQ